MAPGHHASGSGDGCIRSGISRCCQTPIPARFGYNPSTMPCCVTWYGRDFRAPLREGGRSSKPATRQHAAIGVHQQHFKLHPTQVIQPQPVDIRQPYIQVFGVRRVDPRPAVLRETFLAQLAEAVRLCESSGTEVELGLGSPYRLNSGAEMRR